MQETLALLLANNKGADQPARPRNLISFNSTLYLVFIRNLQKCHKTGQPETTPTHGSVPRGARKFIQSPPPHHNKVEENLGRNF